MTHTTTLLLLRHGQTEANRDRRIQGQDDSPLTPEGEAHATIMAEKLRGMELPIEHISIYCSPLARTRDTLERLRTHLNMPGEVRFDPRLMEIDFGEYTGKPVEGLLPTIQQHRKNTRLAYPGGESGDDLKARTVHFLKEAVQAGQGHHLLVMTHFGVIETTLRHYELIEDGTTFIPAHDEIYRIRLTYGESPLFTVI